MRQTRRRNILIGRPALIVRKLDVVVEHNVRDDRLELLHNNKKTNQNRRSVWPREHPLSQPYAVPDTSAPRAQTRDSRGWL